MTKLFDLKGTLMQRVFWIVLYLGGILAANWSITHFGPSAQYVNAFAFIGLAIVVRDKLHDLLAEHRLLKMAALIAAGTVLTLLINPAGGRIAFAGAAAFGLMESVDALSYQACHRLPWLARSNISNLPASVADSIAFPTIAFGAFSATVSFGQFVAKVAGGLVFSLLLARRDVQPVRPVYPPLDLIYINGVLHGTDANGVPHRIAA